MCVCVHKMHFGVSLPYAYLHDIYKGSRHIAFYICYSSLEEAAVTPCYLYLQRLLHIPSEAATYTLRGCYLYLKRLLLIP